MLEHNNVLPKSSKTKTKKLTRTKCDHNLKRVNKSKKWETMKVFLFASLLFNAHKGYICLQAWCSMHIHHENNLSFASSMPNVHVSNKGFLVVDGMQRKFLGMSCDATVSSNVCCNNLLQKMDWLSEKTKMCYYERFTNLFLLLLMLLLQCNQTLDFQRKNHFSY
jgi:hypothetical protein